jgi:hypothetical protein
MNQKDANSLMEWHNQNPALLPVRSEPLLAELFADLQRIDETSILPDGDWVSVCVATWASEWVKRLKDAGLCAECQANVAISLK